LTWFQLKDVRGHHGAVEVDATRDKKYARVEHLRTGEVEANRKGHLRVVPGE
jgi:hypothetical protein